MATLTCAVNEFSCGLACVESILADNSITKTQSEMIADFSHRFPQWVAQPGLTSPDACEEILKTAGLRFTTVEPRTVGEINLRFNEANTLGALIFATRFYDDAATRKSLSNSAHILRLTRTDAKGIEVMNPYRCPALAALEVYSWQEFLLFQGGVFIFQK
jgi:hypothetical protein